jgi:shikimate dehydrogenase
MELFAVTGNPILFSRSPDIFNSIFKLKNIDAKYTRLAASSAKEAIDLFKELNLSGMSVTAPFKTEIIQYLDKIDEMALQIGSVNTVINKDGFLHGYNTDYYGIKNTLPDLNNKRVLLLGAGGAAKAVAYTILKNNGILTIYNLSEEKAKKLADNFKANYCTKQNLKTAVENSDIIINTVPTGVKLIEDNWLKTNHIIFDAIYHNSAYKNITEQLNIKFYSGEDWLINQAIPAFNLFFADKTINKSEIKITQQKPKNKLVFTGFMGSGKSQIGKEISQKIGGNFFSTDTIIETKEHLKINDIFKNHGEFFFRQIENQVLTMLSNMNGKAIVSSGGGVVLDKNNRELIADNFTNIWLYANPNSIMQRAKPENRPLLKDNFNIEYVSNLMEQRKDFYAESADIIINTNNKNLEEIINLILNEISSINE